MRRGWFFCVLVCLPLAAQEIPRSTELASDPFFVKKSWFIGGIGSWDFITMDFQARRLYIAHGPTVQVVDVDSGTLAGEITGLREAHAIALDNESQFGYVSDGLADDVKVFNRRTLNIEAAIPVFCSPRSIAFEPESQLLFAICGASGAGEATAAQNAQKHAAGGNASQANQKQEKTNLSGTSHVVAIDTVSRSVVADMILEGDFRFAAPDGDGHVYVSVGPVELPRIVNGFSTYDAIPQRIAKLDAVAIATEAKRHQEGQSQEAQSQESAAQPLYLDWSNQRQPTSLVHFLPLAPACSDPQSLAVDSKDQRLFAACDNQRFVVVDTTSGNLVASLTTGPGDDALAYDQDRGFIFVANGGGYGSLTIVRQDATTDSFAVIQNLPTQERTRTLAVDPSTGLVYLVTNFRGVDLTEMGGIGSLHSSAVPGSFHVLVVGH